MPLTKVFAVRCKCDILECTSRTKVYSSSVSQKDAVRKAERQGWWIKKGICKCDKHSITEWNDLFNVTRKKLGLPLVTISA